PARPPAPGPRTCRARRAGAAVRAARPFRGAARLLRRRDRPPASVCSWCAVVMDLWSEGMYERLTSVLEPVHGELFERLAPQPGERLLDLGSGTADIALRAARAG